MMSINVKLLIGAKSQLLTTLSAMAISAAAFSYSAQAAVPEQCKALSDPKSEADCACQAALDRNTIEALNEFLTEYGSNGDNACTARAQTQLPDNDPPKSPPSGNGGGHQQSGRQ
jgi:hypothetical protein